MRPLRLPLLLLPACLSLCAPAQNLQNPFRISTGSDPSSLAVGDLDGDGTPDLVYGTVQNGVPVLQPLLHGAAGYSPAAALSLPNTLTPYCRLADVNGDGKADLLCAGQGNGTVPEQVGVLLGQGDDTFQTPEISPVSQAPFGPGNTLRVGAVADLNGDGAPDLLLIDSGTITPMLGDKQGHFTAQKPAQSNSYGLGVLVADLNGDGVPDLVTTQVQGVLQTFLGKGDGTFQPPATIPNDGDTPDDVAVLADVDGDGHVDLISGSGGLVVIYHGNPDGSFSPTPLATEISEQGQAVATQPIPRALSLPLPVST